MTLKILQNFYKATVSRAWAVGTGNRYVSTLPTPTSGYLVINPSNTSKREIVEYSGIGTDGSGNYITIVTRGVGGTTEQTHAVNEPVRMNITAEHYSEVQDEVTDLQDQIDTLVLQNAPNASTTTKGIVKLNVAPADADNPTALGSNDPRLTDLPSNFVSTSAGAGDSGKGVKLNASGVLDNSFLSLTPTVQIFTSSGTWNKPTGLKAIIVEVQGAGAGACGVTSAGDKENGGGGGGYGKKLILSGSLGSTETVTVGAGGSGGASSCTGATNGGTSSFGSHLSCTGGVVGGAGGTSTGGDINIAGQYGQIGDDDSTSGSGGDSILGFGGRGSNANTSGQAGQGYGGGGAGGSSSDSPSDHPGGAGAGGIVIVTEYYI